MTPESLLHDFGLPAFLLVVLGTVVYRSTVYVGRRLFDQHEGIVTIVAKRHVEFLDNLEQSNSAMLTAQQEHSRDCNQQHAHEADESHAASSRFARFLRSAVLEMSMRNSRLETK